MQNMTIGYKNYRTLNNLASKITETIVFTTHMGIDSILGQTMDWLHTDIPAGLSKTTYDSATAMILDLQSIS